MACTIDVFFEQNLACVCRPQAGLVIFILYYNLLGTMEEYNIAKQVNWLLHKAVEQ